MSADRDRNDPRHVVATGYDALEDRYLDWIDRIEGDPRDRFLDELVARLADGARILDLGCGPGAPSTRRLADRFDVVGVDVSEGQLRRAQRLVPEAALVRSDVTEVGFRPGSFAAVTALYTIGHVPRDEHPGLFRSIAGWLRPGGLLLASLQAGGSPGWVGDWLGVEMFFSGHGAEVNRELVSQAGFEVLVDETVEMREPQGPASFQWLLARLPAEGTHGQGTG